ncbi:MAG: D-alanyl-D-alanine carboxypeptidase family protein [Clostridia bacterium]|nr:D-alanyl-D-alanine carboxypeptidase family protein [Clostridia bacterium]
MSKLAVMAMILILMASGAHAAIETAPAIDLNCESAILLEPESGQVIFELQADERRQVASVTKIMAILLACEAVDQGRASVDDIVVVSSRASGMGGSQVLLDTGEKQPLGILIKSMIVASANDAAVAVGEYLYGSEKAFVERMNERAKELGMLDTNFVNPTGLTASGQFTTARDVARMSMELIKHGLFFDYSTIWMDTIDHGDGRITELTNTNRLTRLYEGCDGIKTGSTSEAGYCLSASAVRNGMRLIAVVLGADTSKERFSVASEMLDYGFANYTTYEVAKEGAKVRGMLPVKAGSSEAVELCIGSDMTLLMSKNDAQNISVTPTVPEYIVAPVEKGQIVGRVVVLLDDREIGEVPIVAASDVPRRGYADSWRILFRRWYA